MRKILLTIYVFVATLATAETLYVHKKDGTAVAFDTDDLTEINFEVGNSVVFNEGNNDSLVYANDSLASLISELRNKIYECEKSKVSDLFFLQQVESHRGTCGNYPENTLIGYKKAIENKYYLLEGDICMTADSNYVLLHDQTIDRTSNGSGKCSQMTLEELKKNDYGYQSKYGNKYTGTEIPTLEEIMSLCKQTNTLFEFDCTGTTLDIAHFVGKIQELNMLDKVMFKCTLAQAKELMATVDVPVILGISGSVGSTPAKSIEYAKTIKDRCRALFISVEYTQITEYIIGLAHDEGFVVQSFTVDNASKIAELFDMGVDIVMSNSVLPANMK